MEHKPTNVYQEKMARNIAECLCDPLALGSRPYAVQHTFESALKGMAGYAVSAPEQVTVIHKAKAGSVEKQSNTHIVAVHSGTGPAGGAIAVACIHHGDDRIRIHALSGHAGVAEKLADAIVAASGNKLIRPRVIAAERLPSQTMSAEDARKFGAGALEVLKRRIIRKACGMVKRKGN
jgi:hypothetical protein